MKELTKAEEQVMQVLWKLEKGFLKDIVESMPDPKPAYPTVSTVIGVLVKKEFVGHNTYGKVNEYYPLIKKQEYFRKHMKRLVTDFFGNSWQGFVSSFANSEISLNDLEAIKKEIEAQIKKKQK